MPIVAECQDSAEHHSGTYKVQVLDRAVAILDLLAHCRREMSLVALTEAIGLHKSTVHRLLKVMDAHRLVERSPLTGRYRLGMRLFELGSHAVDSLHLREQVRPHLEWLVAQTGAAAQLSILDRGEMLCIDRIDPEPRVPGALFPGNRYGVDCTAAGKAILACLPENVVREILSRHGMPELASPPITEASALFAELALIRERGYATEFDDADTQTCGVAVALTGSGYPPVALSISGPCCEFAPAHITKLATKLCEAARELCALLASPTPMVEAALEL